MIDIPLKTSVIFFTFRIFEKRYNFTKFGPLLVLFPFFFFSWYSKGLWNTPWEPLLQTHICEGNRENKKLCQGRHSYRFTLGQSLNSQQLVLFVYSLHTSKNMPVAHPIKKKTSLLHHHPSSHILHFLFQLIFI